MKWKEVIKKVYIEFNKAAAKAYVYAGKTLNLPYAKKNYWLIGAFGGRAYSDNSAAFFEYLLKNHPDKNVYWVINRNSPDTEKVIPTNQYVYRRSFKANVMSLLSEVHITSHGVTDISEYAVRNFSHVFKVFFNHGTVGFKKNTNRLLNKQYDLFIANSDFSKQIMYSDWGVAAGKIKITGMPRMDQLFESIQTASKKKRDTKKIFYMPTWREWELKDSMEHSPFFMELDHFMKNPKLHRVLYENNYDLNLYIHINFLEFQEKFEAYGKLPHINILPLDANIHQELVSSDVLITDYSSVAWDFLFLNKEVLFFQPDLESYEEKRSSYVDFRNGLFGKRFADGESLIEAINELTKEKEDDKGDTAMRTHWREKAFAFQDNHNSDRVFAAIMKNLE